MQRQARKAGANGNNQVFVQEVNTICGGVSGEHRDCLALKKQHTLSTICATRPRVHNNLVQNAKVVVVIVATAFISERFNSVLV